MHVRMPYTPMSSLRIFALNRCVARAVDRAMTARLRRLHGIVLLVMGDAGQRGCRFVDPI